MSSQPSSSSSRKRNRWGGGGGREEGERGGGSSRPPRAAAVSEEDALQALLSSAQQKQQDEQQRKAPRRSNQDNDDGPARRSKKEEISSSSSSRRGSRGGPKQDDYYGPASDTTAATKMTNDEDLGGESAAPQKQKPNFGLSGALSKDMKAGNTYKGIVLKFREPPEARAPNTLWRFYVFTGKEELETLHVSRQSAYLFGRNNDVCDIVLQHPSCSSQHAVLQYRALPNRETGKLQCQPYLMDLESTNGSFINGIRIDAARYYQLKKGDVLKFGASTREYVLLTANSTSVS